MQQSVMCVLYMRFSPRCVECRRGLVMRIILSVCLSVGLSVHLSVSLSNAWIVTKRRKDMSRFLYHTEKKNVWWGDPF